MSLKVPTFSLFLFYLSIGQVYCFSYPILNLHWRPLGQNIAHLEQLAQMPYWIPHHIDFSYFWSTSYPDTSCQVGMQPSWISNLNNFSFFNLQVTRILSSKFLINWTFGSEEVQNRFSWWWLQQPSWISSWNNFSYFLSTLSISDTSCQVLSQLAILFRRRCSK